MNSWTLLRLLLEFEDELCDEDKDPSLFNSLPIKNNIIDSYNRKALNSLETRKKNFFGYKWPKPAFMLRDAHFKSRWICEVLFIPFILLMDKNIPLTTSSASVFKKKSDTRGLVEILLWLWRNLPQAVQKRIEDSLVQDWISKKKKKHLCIFSSR